MNNNIILKSDSYKVCHHNQYPKGTEYVYSYFESRKGAKFNNTPFFGLQYILKTHLEGQVVTKEKIEEAAKLFKFHFGDEKAFNKKGWEYILEQHNGYLPVKIMAVPEGTPVEVSNVLMTIVNTDPKCYWLTNYLETILTQVWYPSTVCALSRETKLMIKNYLRITADTNNGLNFMLHDFGFRGASSYESAGIGGMAHLVNFLGTDTLAAMEFAIKYYNADIESLAFSVPATEHSIMTALGKEKEIEIVDELIDKYPSGILSVVADSYNIYDFVADIVGSKLKNKILNRDGVFVVRPDSVTPEHPTPEQEMVWIMDNLWENIGGHINSMGYKVLNPKIRVLWGDGIDINGIKKILQNMADHWYSAENIATFGMGGGLLQKINRDTQRFAFKSSAQCRDGVWYDIHKKPKDLSKLSKKGKLKLIKENNKFYTVSSCNHSFANELKLVFENGKIVKEYTFDEIRIKAKV